MDEESFPDDMDDDAPAAPGGKDGSRAQSSVYAEMGDVRIYYGKPLPQFDIGPVKAYAASIGKDKSSTESPKNFALICEPELVPRRRISAFYKEVISPGLLRLEKASVCYWAPAGEQRFAVVYDIPEGEPLAMPDTENFYKGWRIEKIADYVVRPIISGLHEFHDKEFFHGGIRLTNMFLTGNEKDRHVVLGDCLSAPPSFAQPVLYETVERAIADPYARGPGTVRDDLYALGVSLALLMCQEKTIAGLSDEQIVRKKIEMGSYSALTGGERFSGPSLELLRGLLQDDETQRWGLDDVINWLDGRRLSPQQQKRSKQAMRTLKFAGEKYVAVYPLAVNLHKYKEEACNLIDSGELEDWLNRSVEDKDAAERLNVVMSASQTGEKTQSLRREYLVSVVRMALAPSLPIYYKNMSMTSEGIGTALARAYVRREELKPFHEMFRDKIPVTWYYVQEGFQVNASRMQAVFEACRQAVRQTRTGDGLERCLYMLSIDAPCLSPGLEGYYIRNAKDLSGAFESLCEKGRAPESFLDRHSVAFLSVRDPKMVESVLFDLNSPERHRNILAELKVFAAIQKRHRLAACPHIAGAFLQLLPPVYERFHDRELRETIEKKVQKHARSGDLVQMAETLDDVEVKKADTQRFRMAMQEYRALTIEQERLERGLANKGSFGRASGHNVSVMVSGVLSALLVLLVLFSSWSGHGYF